jgi:DNA polymerase-3 subunit delta
MPTVTKVKRFYLFHGEDDYTKLKKVKDMVNSFVDKGFEAFDYSQYEGRGLDAAEVINAVSSPPFGSPLRVVVLRNFEKVTPKNQEMIVKFLDQIPEYASLVMTCGKLDGNDKKKKVFKALLTPKGNSHEFKAPTPESAAAFIKEIAKEQGYVIAPEAIDYLIETVGCEIGILEQELGKVAIFVGEGKTITEADVASLIGAGTLGTVFDLPVKAAEGDIAGALKLLRKLLLTKESEGTILYRIKDFFLKLNAAKIANTNAWGLARKYHLTIKAAESYVRIAPKVSFAAIINCLHHIYESEISLKSAGMRKDLLLVDLVCRLGNEVRRE